MKKIISIILICLFILCNINSITYADDNAIDITSTLRFNCDYHDNLYTTLKQIYTSDRFRPNEVLTITWKNQIPVYIGLQFHRLPDNVIVTEYKDNNIINSYTLLKLYDQAIQINTETTSITLTSENGMIIDRIYAYTEGKLPEPFYNWNETPDKVDYLVIATHPDDDVLFMGCVIPILTDKGYIGTTVCVTTPNRTRLSEELSGAWYMGTKYQSIFLHFQDIPHGQRFNRGSEFKEIDVTLSLVRLFREKKPLVVFTHDIKGEYGHWQHLIVSKSVIEAAKLANDPSYDEESYNKYGTWEVKKVYVHLYKENTYQFDIHTSLESFDNMTAYEIAKIAFTKHKTQQNTRFHVYDDNEAHAMSKWGMAYGTVNVGNDIFDNIKEDKVIQIKFKALILSAINLDNIIKIFYKNGNKLCMEQY